MPFTDNVRCSQAKPTSEEIEDFSSRLKDLLSPFFEITGEKIKIVSRPHHSHSWMLLDVFTDSINQQDDQNEDLIAVLKTLADNEGASLIKAKLKDGHLLLGILAQYRYWTPSRARMLSMDILRNSSDIFPVEVV